VTPETRILGPGRSGQRGGVLTEFALCVPIALLILLGTVDFGRVWTLANASAAAAQVGAQFGIQSPNHAGDTYGIRTATLNALAASSVIATSSPDEEGGMSLADFTVTSERFCECPDGSTIDCANKCGGGATPAVFVSVRVDTEFNTLFNYRAIPNRIPITRVAVMRAR
jgi:Flp pilus assembly protein TadG